MKSKGFDGIYTLTDESGKPVHLGTQVQLGETSYTITGGQAPHREGTSGNITVKTVSGPGFERLFYAHVANLKWVKS
jgi:hypothetical protein